MEHISSVIDRTMTKQSMTNLYKRSGLFLWGKAGTGKTHLAEATRNELIKKGLWYKFHSRFISTSELLVQIRNTFNRRSAETELDIINDYSDDLNYLFLDDFGAEKLTDFSIETIYVLLSRWEKKRKDSQIFITSNFDIKTIAEIFSDRIASRIVGMCEIIKLSGKDIRLTKTQAIEKTFENFIISEENKEAYNKCKEFIKQKVSTKL